MNIRFTLRSGVNAICDKPLVLNPWNIDSIKNVEKDTGKKVNTILQLRLHPSITKLKNKIEANKSTIKHDVDLSYITARGNWYLQSWKGKSEKSGGIATNIGVHFFDMLYFLFGELQVVEVHIYNEIKEGHNYIIMLSRFAHSMRAIISTYHKA